MPLLKNHKALVKLSDSYDKVCTELSILDCQLHELIFYKKVSEKFMPNLSYNFSLSWAYNFLNPLLIRGLGLYLWSLHVCKVTVQNES